MGNRREVGSAAPARRPGRSFVLIVLVLVLLASALSGFLRLQAAVYSFDVLTKLGLTPGPLYAALSGGLWGLISLVAALGLFLRLPWAPLFTRIGVALLALAYWIDRLALTRSPDAQVNAPFAAILTGVLLFYAFGVLSLEKQKKFFKS
jgi:hypothetical protein